MKRFKLKQAQFVKALKNSIRCFWNNNVTQVCEHRWTLTLLIFKRYKHNCSFLFAELQRFKYFQLAEASTSVFTTQFGLKPISKQPRLLSATTIANYWRKTPLGFMFSMHQQHLLGQMQWSPLLQFICQENRLSVRKWIIMEGENCQWGSGGSAVCNFFGCKL
jgi:hypothetical protein